MRHQTLLHDKFQESLASVLPITIIVLLLCFTVAPIPNNMLVSFLMGAVLLIVGMAFFTLGADTAMTPIGTKVGSCITKSRKIWMIVFVSFLLGVIITISEPDLQVLANQVPNIPNAALIGTVALGVGIFLVIAMLRILFGISLNILLIGFYIVVFLMAMFVPKNFWAVAFDSGGVTTGPMTVPFIMALGVGDSKRPSRRERQLRFGRALLDRPYFGCAGTGSALSVGGCLYAGRDSGNGEFTGNDYAFCAWAAALRKGSRDCPGTDCRLLFPV